MLGLGLKPVQIRKLRERLILRVGAAANTQHQVLEMENTGASIMSDLHSQRESLLRTKSTLAHASEGLETSRRLVRSMARRAAGNKLVLYVVIFLIFAIIILVLWKQGGGVQPDDGAHGVAKQEHLCVVRAPPPSAVNSVLIRGDRLSE